jgi:hypothetical protein
MSDTPPSAQTPQKRPMRDGVFYDELAVGLDKIKAPLEAFFYIDGQGDRSEQARALLLTLGVIALEYTEEAKEILKDWWQEGRPV